MRREKSLGRCRRRSIAFALAGWLAGPALGAVTAPPETPPIGFIADDGGALRFGEAVSADGEIVAIGSPTAGDRGNEAGEVRVLRIRRGPGGFEAEERARIRAAGGGDRFGSTLALRRHAGGLLLAVGAEAADRVDLYMADEAARPWTRVASISPLRPDPGCAFGASIAVSEDGRSVLVGAPRADHAGYLDAGAAHLFTLDEPTGAWKEVARIASATPRMSGWFGAAVAMSGTLVAVGAPGEESNGLGGAGTVHFHTRAADGTVGWSGTLRSPDGLPASWFGASVCVDAERIVVGEPRAQRNGIRCGAAWVWSSSARTAGPQRIDPSEPQHGLGFGQRMALADGWLAVGASGHDRMQGAERIEDCGRAMLVDLDGENLPLVLGVPHAAPSSLLGASVAISLASAESGSTQAVSVSSGSVEPAPVVLVGHLFVEEESIAPSPGVAVFGLSGTARPAWPRHPPDTSARASVASPRPSRRK